MYRCNMSEVRECTAATGELLCRESGISHYVGFDVARRQLDLARRRLSNAGCSHELVLVDSSRGDATDFVSHAWKYEFEELVSALEAARLPASRRFWVDCLVVNQHVNNEAGFEWWSSTFRASRARARRP